MFEGKYEDVAHDSLDIYFHENGEYEITNESLNYFSLEKKETNYLRELFRQSSFTLIVDEKNLENYHAYIDVHARTSLLVQVPELVEEYRMLNRKYISTYKQIEK